ncbi:MAG TPA: hypothetical protein VEC57_12105 [Candidatus Limnocylindrales bacterium]|nr:hypothetical protein [Candidatus Limnocylindrales bacterium]
MAIAAVPLAATVAASAIVADSADDVCAAADDPCIVSQEVQIAGLLDFGGRTVHVTGDGRLSAGANHAEVRCGNLTADVGQAHAAIIVRGTSNGTYHGGSMKIRARLGCDGGPGGCMSDEDCHLGSCSVRRCSLRPSVTCEQETDCMLGTCIPPGLPNARRCTGNNLVRCSTNTDCSLGTCPTDKFCQAYPNRPVACSTDTDCDFGLCTIESGSVDLGGAIQGEAEEGGWVDIEAAGDVTLRRTTYLSATAGFSDAGRLEIHSFGGSVRILAPVDATGALGGDVEIEAAVDVHVDGKLRLTGGVAGGGFAQIIGWRDVVVTDDVLVNGSVNGGRGGYIYVDAGRDVRIEGGSASDRVLLTADGAAIANIEEADTGDAGDVEVVAGDDIHISAYGRFSASGGAPHGPGGSIWWKAIGDIDVHGRVSANSTGAAGSAGFVHIQAGEDVFVHSAADLEALGILEADAGGIEIDAGGSASIHGRLELDGSDAFAASGNITLAACNLQVGANALVHNKANSGGNELRAGGAIEVASGAAIKNAQGWNLVRSRSDAPTPSIQGAITPPPAFVVDDTIEACVPCQDPGQAEPIVCDDDVACTTDLCTPKGCTSTPQHSLCADGSFCNGQELCDAGAGCVAADAVDCSHLNTACAAGSCSEQAQACIAMPVADGTACDDADACTTGDACSSGVCQGGEDPSCAVCGDGTVDVGEECDDGDDDHAPGDACASDCSVVPCGFPLGGGRDHPGASDALYVLRAAISLVACAMSVCDVDGNASLSAGDSLYLLAYAVGRDLQLQCPP